MVVAIPALGKALEGSFPGTVIGVPACTVNTLSRNKIDNPFHFLAENIPAGGKINQVVPPA
jgi:hypothetical protein